MFFQDKYWTLGQQIEISYSSFRFLVPKFSNMRAGLKPLIKYKQLYIREYITFKINFLHIVTEYSAERTLFQIIEIS